LYFRRALRQAPDYADAKYWVARMYYYQLQYAHALAELEPFIHQYPQHPRTADALREIVDASVFTLGTPQDVLFFLNRLLEHVGDQLVYEPHGVFMYELPYNFMSAKVWLLFRIADIQRR
ncbi:unnamed protein product, partial [marine sediment metagenome]